MKVCLISLGCDKNNVDSEKFLYNFLDHFEDAEIIADVNRADFIIVNTCAFINDAKVESIKTIKNLIKKKNKNPNLKILVIGCLVKDIREFKSKTKVDKYCDEINIETGKLFKDIDYTLSPDEYSSDIDTCTLRIKDNLSYSAYLKISEGCNRYCSYCRIPYLRGKYRSVPMPSLIDEASNLAFNGARELNIVAQDVLPYGYDLYGRYELPKLINKLSEIETIDWIRLLYCYPEEFTDEIIDVVAKNKKVVKYLDIPLQHISDYVLKSMNRHITKKEILQIIDTIRNRIPKIKLRTTLMVGFPEETQGDFLELLKFVRDIKFDRLGVFCFSRQLGTNAFRLKDTVDEKTKLERKRIILDAQKEISYELNKQYVGKSLKVMCEGFLEEKGVYVGRTEFDAPGVDNKVYFKDIKKRYDEKNPLYSGSILNVKITDHDEYDLFGEI